jgi:murein DD-endopeptidase MepM/ murein hydrolase activator NlpD
VLSIALLGIAGSLQAARPIRHAKKVVHASSSIHKVRRRETAAKIARTYGLTLEELAALNPRVNFKKLAVGTPLLIKGRPQVAKVEAAEIPVVDEPTAVPAAPVPPIPFIPADGPMILVHLERLIPVSVSAKPSAVPSKSARFAAPITAGDLVPVFPAATGLEYESQLTADLGFEPADPNHLDLLWPVGTRSISSAWGPRIRTKTVRVVKASKLRRVRVRYQGTHKGVDLTAPMGADVFAAQDGRVVFSGKDGGYGNCIFVDHGNGVETRYAHHRLNFVHEGDLVRRGQKIAEVGVTGHSTGPHLHFELRLDGESVNPLPVLDDVEEIPAEMVALNEMVTTSRR